MKKLKIYDKLIRQIFTEVLCYNKWNIFQYDCFYAIN